MKTPTADEDNRLADQSQVAARHEQAAAEFGELYDDPSTVAWQVREAAAREASSSPPSSPSSPSSRARARIASMGAAALAREEAAVASPTAVGVPVRNFYVDTPPPPPPPSSGARLSRLDWHKAELARLQLEARIAKQQKAKLAARVRDEQNAEDSRDGWRADRPTPATPATGVWSASRTSALLRARAKVRARTMEARPAAVRDAWRALCADAETAHFAIGIKRACDRRGWTLADVAAQRAFAILEFLRELVTPYCWNARHVRSIARRGSRRRAMPTAGSESFEALKLRRYSPTLRGVSQTFLATVAAAAGHTATDDRSCSTKTVQRALRLLEDVGLVQSVQVPAHAAEPFELGDSGHAINRYFLADRGNPKPALMACWTLLEDADGGAVLMPAHEDVLALPWLGARISEAPS